jgi:hypothetical protein
MNWIFENGIAKAAIEVTGPDGEPWVPNTDSSDRKRYLPQPEWSPTENQVLALRHVCEIFSGACSSTVIVEADSLEELPKAVAHVKAALRRLFDAGYRRHQSRKRPRPSPRRAASP